MSQLPFTEVFKGGKEGRQYIFESAAGVFTKKGYHKTTVEEIAAAIGVSKGTIYYYFKNKEELYLAIIREGIDLFHEQLAKAAQSPASPQDKIRKLIRGHFIFCEKEKDLVFLFLKELGSTDFSREILADMLAKCLQVFRNVLEEGIAKKVFRPVNPEIITSALFGMLTITAFHYLSYSRGIPLEPASLALEDIFFNGICR
ncbi:Fatty acid metabolism regulator protein [Pelotomaculum schinkii]|uniref:Fatty acid metabolism regulator protein n=1 Tax=Pelotomaculum schinkii TaxID=78350 RepID=A0A4Y7R5M2_9FIRM|nr:TetR/AcrR family transcriptional regulator [Pelotomaculum schinkii]TEB04245.1 Fatty acid metabolism regulator protein [Pelotomaculum schinkii]